ncbi:MAG: PKD domain-containing protein [Anaerolineae bacterium]
MRQKKALLVWLVLLVLWVSYSVPLAYGHADSDDLVLLTTIETGGQPSALVVDQAAGRNDVVFYDGDRVRFVDGDTLTLASESISLPTTQWEGWMVHDPYHQHTYVVTTLRRETALRVGWREVQVTILADRAVIGAFSVNANYNTDPNAPADRFYGLDGLVLKPPMSEGTNPARLIIDDTANGNLDVVDLNVTGTDAVRRQRYSYRDSLCTFSSCRYQTNSGNTLALEPNHETATPDDLAGVDLLYIADLNNKEQGIPLDGHLRVLQLGQPGQALNTVELPDVDLSGTWPFCNGNKGLAMATGRDVLYVASEIQSFDTGYIGEVDTVTGQLKRVIELTYCDQGFVTVDPQDARRVFVGTFDDFGNDPSQALYLRLIYDGVVVDSLKLLDNYDEYNGLRAMVYDPLHQRLYLAIDSSIYVVAVNQGTNCPKPLVDVDIAGSALGESDIACTFSAIPSPSDATPPVAYTWSPAPLSGQGTATATYRWSVPGDYAVSVEAENCSGKRSATHEIAIRRAEDLMYAFLPTVLR